ncbi:MAG: cadherin-like domain-containing protein, partial [Burkholderiales bacterium]|nr:cadherin-like domain-containing protein [Burkholderiales bacterium]
NATDNTYTVTEDTAVNGNVITDPVADSDIDGDTLTVTEFAIDANGDGSLDTFAAGSTATITLADGTSVGTLIVRGDGSFTFTPAPNYNGTIPEATYTITDGKGGFDTAKLILGPDIIDVNDDPNATDNTYTVTEDTAVNGNVITDPVADSDIDGDTLTVTEFAIDVNGDGSLETFAPGATADIRNALGQAIGTLVVRQDGSFTFTPAANYDGLIPQATYTITDGHGGFDTARLILGPDIINVDDPSVLVADTKTVLEDSQATGNVLSNDSDIDNVLSVASFVINGVSHQAGDTVNLSGIGSFQLLGNGDYSFTPVAHWSGTVPVVTYTTNTGSSSTLSIDVTPVADKPNLTVTNPLTSGSIVFSNSWEANVNEGPDGNGRYTSTSNANVTTFEGWTRIDTGEIQPGGLDGFEVWSNFDDQGYTQNSDSNQWVFSKVVAAAGNGDDILELNDSGDDTLPQTLGIGRDIATQSGQIYELSFDYAGRPGYGTGFTTFGFYVDGVLVREYSSTSPQSYLDWKNVKFHFEGDGQTHRLEIRTNRTQYELGGRGAMIDDISVASVGAGVVNANGGTFTGVSLARYVTTSLVDTDGSETLRLTFSGLLAGTSIVTASGTYNVDANGNITILGTELSSAVLRLPTNVTGHITFGVQATATESGNGSTASSDLLQVDLNIMARLTERDITGENLNNLFGTLNNDNQTGTANADRFIGSDGNDTQNGNAGNDVLDGGAGVDILNGGDGNDTIWGGTGNDTMTGGNGSDTFAWTLADRGATHVDTITDFNAAAAGAGGDVLDLRDFLVGEWVSTSAVNNLQNYLDFDTTTTPGTTTIRISSIGGFLNGVYDPSKTDQSITLTGVDLRTALGLTGTATDAQIIQELINRNKLLTDNGT